MKRIKKGKLPKEKFFEGTCKNCEERVRFSNLEAQRNGATAEGVPIYEVTCPTCAQVIVGTKEVDSSE